MGTGRVLEMRRIRRTVKRRKTKKKVDTRPKRPYKVSFASKFEQNTAKDLESRGVKYTYETDTVEYMKVHSYRPDFKLPNGIYVETKGRFTSPDRAKHLLIRAQHPEVDVRFVFMRDLNLYKGSKTKYSEWCKRHGFRYAFHKIPQEWIDEDKT